MTRWFASTLAEREGVVVLVLPALSTARMLLELSPAVAELAGEVHRQRVAASGQRMKTDPSEVR